MSLGTPETVEADEARRRAKNALARISLDQDPVIAKVETKAAQPVTIRSTFPGLFAYAEPRQKAGHHIGTRRYMEAAAGLGRPRNPGQGRGTANELTCPD